MSSKTNRDRVAELAGVSSATVSRVYNNPDRVSEAKKKAVLEAARQLGYAPDKSASALRRKGTGQITLVRFDKNRPWYWGNFPAAKWFYTDVLQGIMDVVDRSMYRLNLKTFRSPADAAGYPWEQECDGVIFYDVDTREEADIAASCPVPSVISHHTSQYENCARCSTDNYHGGLAAGRHLAESGYQRPVFISFLPDRIISSRERCRGFRDAFPRRDVRELLGEPGKEGGYASTRKILKEIRSGEVDSLGVVNDLTAIGVIHCLQDEGLKPGRDVALIGYDNMPLNYVLPFRLATVDLRPTVIYREAAEMLLEILRGGPAAAADRSRVVLPELVTGDSV